MSKVRILIGPKGQIKIQPIGITGAGCVEATKDLEDRLGKVTHRESTDEMYQQDVGESLYDQA